MLQWNLIVAYHADVIAVQKDLWQLRLSSGVVTAIRLAFQDGQVLKRVRVLLTVLSRLPGPCLRYGSVHPGNNFQSYGILLLTDEVIETEQSTAELWAGVSLECVLSEMVKRTFVAFHDDPDRRADTAVDELQGEQLRRHLEICSGQQSNCMSHC